MKRTTIPEMLLLDKKPGAKRQSGPLSPNNSDNSADSQESYFLAADLFSLFADSTALMIWDVVRKKQMSASAIVKKVQAARHLVLKKLLAMEKKGLLVSNTQSGTTYYRMADLKIAAVFNRILGLPERDRKRTGNIGKEGRLSRQKVNKCSDPVISVRRDMPK
jgi:hypothetical protein